MAGDKSAVRKILDAAKADKRAALTAPEGKLVCDAYGIPVPQEGVATSAADAAKLAVDLDLEVVPGYIALVGAGDRTLRKLAATRMQDAAIRAAHWGGRPTAFPGLRTS